MDAPSETETGGNGSQLVSELGPRLGLCPPIPYRPKKDPSDGGNTLVVEPNFSALDASTNEDDNAPSSKAQDFAEIQQVLIVDDNAINRRLLSVFMKKRKLSFKEAKDGLQALDTYKEANGKFDVILMDISM